MLNTKYQGSGPSSFRVEELLVLIPGAFYEQTWWRSTRKCHIQNIKSLHHSVSEKKNFGDGLLCSYVPTCDPRGGASFDPRGII